MKYSYSDAVTSRKESDVKERIIKAAMMSAVGGDGRDAIVKEGKVTGGEARALVAKVSNDTIGESGVGVGEGFRRRQEAVAQVARVSHDVVRESGVGVDEGF